VAGAGAAYGNQNVVVDLLAAASGEDRGRLVKYACYYWLLLAESPVPRCLFGSMPRRMETLPATGG
jgi:hypothetical protein